MAGYLILSYSSKMYIPHLSTIKIFLFCRPARGAAPITQIHRPLLRRYEFMTLSSLFFKVSLFHL